MTAWRVLVSLVVLAGCTSDAPTAPAPTPPPSSELPRCPIPPFGFKNKGELQAARAVVDDCTGKLAALIQSDAAYKQDPAVIAEAQRLEKAAAKIGLALTMLKADEKH